MSTSKSVSSPKNIEKICSRIYSECSSIATWNWDDRFQAVLSEFPAEQQKEVISVLEKYFDSCWDDETINYAPGKIRSVAKELGEVREGQRLFSSDPNQDGLLLGAYWPWQNGERVSLRMHVDIAEIDLELEPQSSEVSESALFS